MTRLKKHLPLLQVLKEMKGYQRQIIVDHLDIHACDALSDCISTVIKKRNVISSRKKKKLSPIIKANRKILAQVIGTNKTNAFLKKRKRNLAKIGGNPLLSILTTAIPLLLGLF